MNALNGLPHAVPLAVGGALAAMLALVGTPVAIRAARATGFMDHPAGSLKKHAEPTPYLGGMAVFVPFLVAAALAFPLDQRFLATLLAASLAALLGLMDDFGAMRPAVKLAGQGIVVLVLLDADVRIGIDVLPTPVNLALTALWMVAMMNAVNFLDVMDGLAATVALVATAFFLVIALLTHNAGMASLSAVLLGSLAGYVRYAWPRAQIFLGDSGSLFLGTVLGSLALALDYSEASPWGVLTPLLVLGIPCFELASTVVTRVVRGQQPWRGSADHVALRLRRWGLSPKQVLALACATGILAGVAGLRVQVGTPFEAAWIVGIAAVLALAAGGTLVLTCRGARTVPPRA